MILVEKKDGNAGNGGLQTHKVVHAAVEKKNAVIESFVRVS